jgi:ribosomal 50S subunit-associated protein YjgA (DUF615 family)
MHTAEPASNQQEYRQPPDDEQAALLRTIRSLFLLVEDTQYKQLVQPLLPKLIEKLPFSIESLARYPDKNGLVRVIISAIEKKRRLTQRGKYLQLQLLGELMRTEQESLQIDNSIL